MPMYSRLSYLTIAIALIALLTSVQFAFAGEWGGYSVPIRGAVESCTRTAGSNLSIEVIDNLTFGVTGSESLTVTVPGFGTVAAYADPDLIGPAGGLNVITFAVTTAYAVPANTSIAVEYTSYRERDFGGDSKTYTFTYDCTTGQGLGGGAPFSDARINQQPFASAAIFCGANSSFDVWAIDARGQGTRVFTATAREITRVPVNPTVNTIIDQFSGPRGAIQLYRLTSGEFQLVSPGQAGDDSKVYNFIFPGCIARVQ